VTPVPGVPWPPEVHVTPTGYEAVLRLPGGEIRIREDGRVGR
jgi:hypothetical protein